MPIVSLHDRMWRTGCVVLLLLSLPAPLRALEIRSVELQSSLDEPFHAIVRLRVLPEARFLPECLRVLMDDSGGVPLTLETTLRRDGDRILARVRAAEILRTPEAAVRIVAGCKGDAEVFRSFLISVPPDDAPLPQQASAESRVVDRANGAIPARPPIRTDPPVRAAHRVGRDHPAVASAVRQWPRTAPPGASSPEDRPAPPARSVAPPGDPFVLRLSGDDLDTSITARVTEAQRNVLKAYRRLAEADDSTARLMEMEDRIRGLELELARIRSAETAIRGPSERPDARTSRISEPGTIAPAPAGVTTVAVPQPDEGLSLFTRLVAGIVLGAWSFVAAWHVVRRRYVDREARRDALGSPATTSPHAGMAVHPPATHRAFDGMSQVNLDLDLSSTLGGADASHLVLSDVDLFLELGRHESAVGLLRDELDRNPDNRRYWEKLAWIHATHGHRGEWERVLGTIANRFGIATADAIRYSSGHQ